MNNKQVQICIVSGEPMANILPIRALKPDIVVLVVSPRMKEPGERLGRFLARHGIRSVEAFDALIMGWRPSASLQLIESGK